MPGGTAAGQRPQPRQQLAEVERLDQVVVRAGVEPGDPVGHRVARGEHQDRGADLAVAQPPAGLEPVDARQVDVEDDRVVRRRLGHPHGVLARRGDVGQQPLLREATAQQGCQAGLVLHQEHAHGGYGTAERMTLERVTLRDGTCVAVRPIRPDDRDALAAGFERLSPESRYRRFFSPVSRLTDRQLEYLTRVDHHDHEALVAVDEASGALIGVARFVRIRRGEAEPAMVVADDWQGRGVGTALLERLVDRAFDEGVDTFRAQVLAGNAEAIRILQRLGDTDVGRQGAEAEVRVRLRERGAAVGPLRALLRGVAAGTIDPALSFWHRLLPRAPRGEAEEEKANLVVAAVADAAGES